MGTRRPLLLGFFEFCVVPLDRDDPPPSMFYIRALSFEDMASMNEGIRFIDCVDPQDDYRAYPRRLMTHLIEVPKTPISSYLYWGKVMKNMLDHEGHVPLNLEDVLLSGLRMFLWAEDAPKASRARHGTLNRGYAALLGLAKEMHCDPITMPLVFWLLEHLRPIETPRNLDTYLALAFTDHDSVRQVQRMYMH
ncbi:hypothetical protein Cgig2_025110 [Carnegiea gigantea]|uniref:Uncharacterized protein n=1 Tax=Carnegiea gigantea TaxID=171969 RepID=A0A9Q1QA91_9CARY|nr:hypothetical protein Cgig2_025110 [Carnegiea gigantea]